MNVLLTGATGFVGRGMLARLCAEPGVRVRVAVRRMPDVLPDGVECTLIQGLSVFQCWDMALQGIDVVIHAAAQVRVLTERCVDPLAELRAVNVDASRHLARQAAAAGAKRFVYVSSIKANGEETELGRPYCAESPAFPKDPYGQSKLEAEQALFAVGEETGLEVVVVRSPLVYGPGVKANFASLMRALQQRLPLPFAAIDNRRSLVARDNLVDLLLLCARHPAAVGRMFLVSDGRDLSTAQLCRELSEALGVSPRLLPVPTRVLRMLGLIVGRGQQMQRLLGSLQVDISATCQLLDWKPPVQMRQAIQETAQWCREHRGE
ncbi:NAD-dependent epimerase/dehydratase family protein [Pseudomonas sp. B1-22]|uniref:NAD-dependent epimerase/dehydratase family protein n=1 Tax=Pseudomonas sp. B1-22 TaxID=3141456 RepID=UPI003D268FA6